MAFSSNRVEQTSNRPSVKENWVEDGLTKLPVLIHNMRFKNVENGFFILNGIPPKGENWPLGTHEGRPLPTRQCVFRGTSKTLVELKADGETFDFLGNWIVDPQYGLQFNVVMIRERTPSTPEALLKYLSSGRLKGVGPATAKNIVEKWGMETLEILDKTPERLSEIPGLNEKKIKTITESWKEKRAIYELVSFLGLHGLGEGMAVRIREGLPDLKISDVIRRIQSNPYSLTEIDGVGFKTADQLALSLGFATDDPTRVSSALEHLLKEATSKDGHTAIPGKVWAEKASIELNLDLKVVREACKDLIEKGRVILRSLPVERLERRPQGDMLVYDPMPCVQPRFLALTEESIVDNLMRLSNATTGLSLEQLQSFTQGIEDPARHLDPSQKSAAWLALTSDISVLTGGPGTGKSTTLKTVVHLATEAGLKVVLSAPTGRASKRMEEVIQMPASTMHRCLGYRPGGNGGFSGFTFNETNQMDGDLFIVDESSMIDSVMMSAWLKAIPTGARVLFVGDADQLPSVGAGDVLRNMIQSKRISVARLTEVHRQAKGSAIALNAQRVLAGKSTNYGGDPITDEFAFVDATGNDVIADEIKSIVNQLLDNGAKPEDIQILAPQKNGEAGTENLNHVLRWILNPLKPNPNNYDEIPRIVEGERLMQIKNNYDLGLFNGDMGTVKSIDPDTGDIVLTTEDGREVELSREFARQMVYGYAITVHKSQGGERPIVLMPMSKSHTFSLNQSLLYTGITRGKQKVILVGERQTSARAARKIEQTKRLTGLSLLLTQKMPELSNGRSLKPV